MHSLDHAISYTEDNNQLFLSTSWLFRSVTCRIEIERGGPLMLTLLQKKVNKGKSCDIQPCDHGRVLSGLFQIRINRKLAAFVSTTMSWIM